VALRGVIAAATAAATVAGCGGGSDDPAPSSPPSGPRGQVTRALKEYQQALEDKDGKRLCALSYLDFPPGAGRDRDFKGDELKQCIQEVDRSREPSGAFDLSVSSVKVSGDSATAKLVPAKGAPKGAGGRPDYRLRRFGDQWKVAFQPG
jgi:hypothetical protein